MSTECELKAQINELKPSDLASWRAMGRQLLDAEVLPWEACKFFMDRCPKAAQDIRGLMRSKMTRAAIEASPKRQQERRQHDQMREAFGWQRDERKVISDEAYKDH